MVVGFADDPLLLVVFLDGGCSFGTSVRALCQQIQPRRRPRPLSTRQQPEQQLAACGSIARWIGTSTLSDDSGVRIGPRIRNLLMVFRTTDGNSSIPHRNTVL